MASVSFRSFAAADFAKYSNQIRAQQGTIPQQQAQQIADHFKVPLATVLALRDELLARAHQGSEQVGQQTRDHRNMAGGWQQPVGMAKVSGVGVNRFMFQKLGNEELRRQPARSDSQPAGNSSTSEFSLGGDWLTRPLRRDAVEFNGVTYTPQDLVRLMDQVTTTSVDGGTLAGWDSQAPGGASDQKPDFEWPGQPAWTALSSPRPSFQDLLGAKVRGDSLEINGKTLSLSEIEHAASRVPIADWGAPHRTAVDGQRPDFAWPTATSRDQDLALLRALLDAFTRD